MVPIPYQACSCIAILNRGLFIYKMGGDETPMTPSGFSPASPVDCGCRAVGAELWALGVEALGRTDFELR